MRKSSPGNPNHDARGRFCSAGDAKSTSVRTKEEYELRTQSRFGMSKVEQEVLNGLRTGDIPIYQDDERTFEKHRILREKFGAGEYDKDREARSKEVFEIDGALYTGCEKRVDGNGVVYYEAKGPDGYSRMITGDQYEFRRAQMPWHNDPKYKNNKNAKLMWLMDHPESKYNDREFIGGIKKIESMSDMGVSTAVKQKQFIKLCERCDIPLNEGFHFIDTEFLK